VDVDFALKDTSAPAGSPVQNRNVEGHLKDLFKGNPSLRKDMNVQLHPTPVTPNHIHIWFIR
ncbi:MAG: hypothetical protein Q9M20_00135, partial [Mariprofundaceae bacterium]|nr:hypothetical protein [Mariprofundaceae bacterium]